MRVQRAEASERDHCELVKQTLHEGMLSTGEWELDASEDNLVNFLDAVGMEVACEALERLEYLAVYRCQRPAEPADLEALGHARMLLDLVRGMRDANAEVQRDLQTKRKPSLSAREARQDADMALLAYMEKTEGWDVVDALRLLEYRVAYWHAGELADWMQGHLLLVREIAKRLNRWSELYAEFGCEPRAVLRKRPTAEALLS